MKKVVLVLLAAAIALGVLGESVWAVENLDELEVRVLRKTFNTFYSGESSENYYIWQPQTLCYTDMMSGHEVWVMTSTDDATAFSGHEFGHQPWSADGKRFAIAIDKNTSAFTRGSSYADELWLTARSDGTYLRPRVNSPARIRTHAMYTHWSPVIPDVYYAFGRNYAGEGASSGHLYRVMVTDTNVSSSDIITVSSSERDLPEDPITSDGKYIMATQFVDSTTVAICDLTEEDLKMPEYDSGISLDTYWGDTPSSYSKWHGAMLVGADDNYWIYFLISGTHIWWRMRPWGTDNATPNHTPDTSSPYDWWEGTDEQKEVQPLNGHHSYGVYPDFAGHYWSHATWDRWGDHVAYSDTEGAYVAPGVWDVDNSVRKAFPDSEQGAQYHAWNGWTDYTTGTDGASYVYIMCYDDGTGYEKIAALHVTGVGGGCSGPGGTCFTKPGQSPDGTKTVYRSDFLQPTSTNGDVFYVVTYYPYPPEITQASASSGTVTIRFDWRLDQVNPRGYTTRGWPDEDTDNPPPPRETEKFRLWRSLDNISWQPVGTVNADVFDRYDFSNGTWTGNDYWEITDTPSDGTWYYAVTSNEWSGLESRTLSNVYAITVSGGVGTGSQSTAYPSNPGDIDDPDTSDFYMSFDSSYPELIRYYSIYAEDGSTPTVDQTNRIASISANACSGNDCSWVDWLGNTTATTRYVVTAVDTQGQESSSLSGVNATYKKSPAIADGQYTVEWKIISPDTTTPTRSNPQPTGTLSSGTTSTNISLSTNVQAICRYSNTSDTNYTDMLFNFTSTNSTHHSTPVTGLENGKTYTFYVRCNSSDGYVNEDDFNITFSIDGHKADLNDDDVINMPEFIAYIARWKASNGVSKAEVEDARDIWFTGGVY